MSHVNQERNEISSNNDNNSQGQKYKSDSYSVSNNLPYIYDAPSLNQNNDYKFYDNTSFGNNNKKRNNFSFKNKEEIKFNNPTIERKASEETNLIPNLNENDPYKDKNVHPLVKVINTILTNKYNLGPLEKETLPEKASVFSYNSAFKPIINNKNKEERNIEFTHDIILNSSFEKLSSLKKRNFLLNSHLKSGSKPSSTFNLFRLDNTVIKPRVIKLWEVEEKDENDFEKRLLSRKRNRYDNDDYAKFSPDYERNLRIKNNDLNILSANRTSRPNRHNRQYIDDESEEKDKIGRSFNDSKLSFSNVNMSGLKINPLLSKEADKNSFFSNYNIQNKNDVYFNKPMQIFKNKATENNEINISTIDNLNSSISTKNNFDFFFQKNSHNKTIEDIRAELNEKTKANQKLLNEIYSKTKRNFQDENSENEKFSHSNFVNSSKLLGNKDNLKNFNENYNQEDNKEEDYSLMDEKKKRIAEFYRKNKNMDFKKDFDFNFSRTNKINIFEDSRNKFEEENLKVGKTFSFKNVNKFNKEKEKNEEIVTKNKNNIFQKNHFEKIQESDRESASFGGEESIKEESPKKQEKPKNDENKNILFVPIQKEEEKSLFNTKTLNNNDNKTNINILGKFENIEQNISAKNIFGNFNNNKKESEKEKESHNINEIKQPSIFDKKEEVKPVLIEKEEDKNNSVFTPVEIKDKEINIPENNNLFSNINNNLFGKKDNIKTPNTLFEGEKSEKSVGLFDSNLINTEKNIAVSNTPIFSELLKKKENEEKDKKTVEEKSFENKEPSKPLFGNIGNISTNTNNNLFGASTTTNSLFNLKPNSSTTGLFGENKTQSIFDNKDKKEENEVKEKEKSETLQKPLFSFGGSETQKATNSLFGSKTGSLFGNKPNETTTNSIFGEIKKDEKNEPSSPKFGQNKTNETEIPKSNLFAQKEENKNLVDQSESKNTTSIVNKPEEKETSKENENINNSNNTSTLFGFKPNVSANAINLFAPKAEEQNKSNFIVDGKINFNNNFIIKPNDTSKTEIEVKQEKNEKEIIVDINKVEKYIVPKEEIVVYKAEENKVQTNSLFGNASSLFNGDNNKSKAGLSLFGATGEDNKLTTTSNTGGLFGNSTNSQSLFNVKPLTETTSTSSLFGNKTENVTPGSNSNSLFGLPKQETDKTNLTFNNTSSGLFSLSNNNNQKQTEENKDAKPTSLFGNLQMKAPETKPEVGIDVNNNKSSSLFSGSTNLGLFNNKNENANLNNNNNSFTLFKTDVNNNVSAQSSSLFSGLNNSQNNNSSNNVFVAHIQNKSTSIFNSSLGANLKDNFGENKTPQIEPINNNANNNLNNQSSENQQNKSLLNMNNPFLQKATNIQNSLFTSSNNNGNAIGQNTNTNPNNQQHNAFIVNSDKRNVSNRIENGMGQSSFNNFGSNLFSNENKTNQNLFSGGNVFGQTNPTNSIFSNNSNNGFGSNTNVGTSLFGNGSSLFGNNNTTNNNLNGGGNEDMSISPVRSPNIQPKMNNTNVPTLFGINPQTQNQTHVLGNTGALFSGQNPFSHANNNVNNNNSLFGNNPNPNQGTLFGNATTNNATGLFGNASNLFNTNSSFGGFSMGKK